MKNMTGASSWGDPLGNFMKNPKTKKICDSSVTELVLPYSLQKE